MGPAFGYFPNAIKTISVVKLDKVDEVIKEFDRTDVEITTIRQSLLRRMSWKS